MFAKLAGCNTLVWALVEWEACFQNGVTFTGICWDKFFYELLGPLIWWPFRPYICRSMLVNVKTCEDKHDLLCSNLQAMFFHSCQLDWLISRTASCLSLFWSSFARSMWANTSSKSNLWLLYLLTYFSLTAAKDLLYRSFIQLCLLFFVEIYQDLQLTYRLLANKIWIKSDFLKCFSCLLLHAYFHIGSIHLSHLTSYSLHRFCCLRGTNNNLQTKSYLAL